VRGLCFTARPAQCALAGSFISVSSRVRKTLKNLLVEYGATAIVVYLAIFFVVLFGFWAAIRFGWEPSGAMANVGAFTAAYLATKLTQPLRIIATLAVTPLVARVVDRMVKRRPAPAPTTPTGRAD
jgi:hypothetical protein